MPPLGRRGRAFLRCTLALLLLATLLLGWPALAHARLGGGESFGGGGGGGGGGSSGGGGGDGGAVAQILCCLIQLSIEHPVIGVPLTIVFVAFLGFYAVFNKDGPRAGAAGIATRRPGTLAPGLPQRRRETIASALERVRTDDPNFSRPLFLDFVQLLFVRAHEARGAGKVPSIAPFVTEGVAKLLSGRSASLRAIEKVIVGASRIVAARLERDHIAVHVQFEANFTELHGTPQAPDRRDLYSRELWRFRRTKGVLSKGPADIASLACPSCGSPVEVRRDGTCRYCDQVVGNGAWHWVVEAVMVEERRPKRALEVTKGGGIEVGTDLPSVFQPGFDAARRALRARHPGFSWSGFDAFVRRTFLALQDAWSRKEWERARPFETDHLFSVHRFWIERYKESELTNRLDDIKVEHITPVKIEEDAFYEAITCRIRASMLDYTVDKAGSILSGSKSRRRTFSEYWTFIRRAGFGDDRPPGQAAGGVARDQACPSCGAEVKVNLQGVCEYCNSKVTTGDFSWVLSAIEQDEVYEG